MENIFNPLEYSGCFIKPLEKDSNAGIFDINSIYPHPRNDEFFDDLEGELWESFVADIKNRGIEQPITINQHGTIINGHQRWRAAKELGLETIPARVLYIYDEDLIVLRMIYGNLLQRYGVERNPLKRGRQIKAIREILGSLKGRPKRRREQKPLEKNPDGSYNMEDIVVDDEKEEEAVDESGLAFVEKAFAEFEKMAPDASFLDEDIIKEKETELKERMAEQPPTWDNLSRQYQVAPRTLRENAQLAELTPELQEAVEKGYITGKMARANFSNWSMEEQRDFVEGIDFESLGIVSPKKMKELIAQYKQDQEKTQRENEELQKENEELQRENEDLQKQLDQKEAEVVPESEIEKQRERAEKAEARERSTFEKGQAYKKETDAKIAQMEKDHAKDKECMVRLSRHVAALEDMKEELITIGKLDREDVNYLRKYIDEVENALGTIPTGDMK